MHPYMYIYSNYIDSKILPIPNLDLRLRNPSAKYACKSYKHVTKPQYLLFLYCLCDVQNNKLYGIQPKY